MVCGLILFIDLRYAWRFTLLSIASVTCYLVCKKNRYVFTNKTGCLIIPHPHQLLFIRKCDLHLKLHRTMWMEPYSLRRHLAERRGSCTTAAAASTCTATSTLTSLNIHLYTFTLWLCHVPQRKIYNFCLNLLCVHSSW